MSHEFDFPYWSVGQVLENRLTLVEALAFPEITRLGGDPDLLDRHINANLCAILEATPLANLYRRHIAAPPTAGVVTLPLDPPQEARLWRVPLPLSFHLLRWSHPDAEIAYVPALGIEVVARAADMEERLPVEIRAALARRAGPLGLRDLVFLQRVSKLRVERRSVNVALRTAKARALAAEREHEDRPSVLAKVATPLTHTAPARVIGMEHPVEQMAELLGGRVPRSVLLVGPSGVGKTAAFGELVRRRADFQLGATPFWTTSGARLVAGMSGFGMWQQRCQDVIREASRRRAVLHLGNLVELMHVGKSEHQSTGLAAFLRPAIGRGELLAVAECTPEQLPLIEREDPHLLDAFQRVEIPEPDVAQGRAILEHAVFYAPGGSAQFLAPDALDTLDRLHRRYATYSAYPGRPLRFLRNLLHDCAGEPMTAAHVLTAFMRETGLPRVLLDPTERLDLEQVRNWFAARVLDQPEAVHRVVELLAATKAGLTRPRKPIASLLFIGPTGVGKTETAKALAEFLFGSKDRLTRFDMSEYGDPVAVQRLIGGIHGDEGLLTAKVREQPFSVVLFDEFEKAHPQLFDLLLQVLGEGRLTDAAGRLADFTNAVIILTSNLGAASFQQGAFGFGSTGAAEGQQQTAAREHFEREVQAFLRPEMFNRIDRIVPFAPLGADAIRRIADGHLKRLATRDGVRYRGATLSLSEGVADRLARVGFDARYGARPLLRAVERDLLAPLAEQMNRYDGRSALRAEVTTDGNTLHVEVRARTDAAGREVTSHRTDSSLSQSAEAAVDLRRLTQALERSACVRELQNELWQLEREQAHFEKAQRIWLAWQARLDQAPPKIRARLAARIAAWHVRPADQERIARLSRLREVNHRLCELVNSARVLEDETLTTLYGDADGMAIFAEKFAGREQPLLTDLYDLLLHFYCREFSPTDRVTLALFGSDHEWLLELAAGYVEVAASLPGYQSELAAYCLLSNSAPPRATEAAETSKEKEENQKPAPFWREDVLMVPAEGRQPERAVLERRWVERPEALFAKPLSGLVGLALHLRGAAATPRFTGEAGVHLCRGSKKPEMMGCHVIATEKNLRQYTPPPEVVRRGGLGTADRRRTCDRIREVVEDPRLPRPVSWNGRSLAPVLSAAIDEHLRRRVLTLLDE